MTTQDIITPEYILEQSKILGADEFLILVKNYGEQEYDNGVNAVSWDYH